MCVWGLHCHGPVTVGRVNYSNTCLRVLLSPGHPTIFKGGEYHQASISVWVLKQSLSLQLDYRRFESNELLKTVQRCGSVPKMCCWRARYGSPNEQIHISSSRNGRAMEKEAEDWLVSTSVPVYLKQNCFLETMIWTLERNTCSDYDVDITWLSCGRWPFTWKRVSEG